MLWYANCMEALPVIIATNFAPLKLTYILAMPIAGLWIGVDAAGRFGNGWLWGSIAFACPPVGVPLYYALVIYQSIASSRVDKGYLANREHQRSERRKHLMMGEIERQHYLANAEQSGGTLFQQPGGLAPRDGGVQHFRDERADELIALGKLDDAREYISDLLAVAREDGDPRRVETYKHYLSQLP